MATYQDLYMRDNFTDDGTTPQPASQVSMSPDIIPYGQSTLTATQLIDNYGPPLMNTAIQANNINNIYVRAKNNFTGPQTGQIFLYYSAPTLLTQPSVWSANAVPNNNGNLYANLNASTTGVVAPGDQPFNFTPPASLPPHFCFVTRVVTPTHANPIPPDFKSCWDFIDWVRMNPSVAWHNADIVNTLPPQGYIQQMIFQNVEASQQYYGFTVECSNLPANAIVTLYSLADGSYNGFSTTHTISADDPNPYSLGSGVFFPASYQTTVFATCQFPNNQITPGSRIIIASLGYTASSDTLDERYASFSHTPEAVGIDTTQHGFEANAGVFTEIAQFNVAFG